MDDLDVLIFVEDPGAANYVAQFAPALTERGWHARLLADGLAKDHLLQLGVRPEVVKHPTSADQILTAAQPGLLIVGTAENPDTLGLQLVVEARSAGIECIGVVDMLTNAGRRFRGRSDNPLLYTPDWLMVPDEWTAEAFAALGYPTGRILVCGHPHYDFVRATKARLERGNHNTLRQRVLPGAAADRKTVVFAAEGSAGLTPQPDERFAEYTLTGRGTGTGRVRVVLEEFLDAVQDVRPRPYLILRLHPKDTPADYTVYVREFGSVSRGGSPLELIYAADLVVGLTSMLLLEAVLLGTTTLSVVPRTIEMDWLPSIRAGITHCVTIREQLRPTLANLLVGPTTTSRSDVEDGIPSGCLEAAVDFIEKLLACATRN